VFGKDPSAWHDYENVFERRLSETAIKKYVGMEERMGLAATGKRLLDSNESFYSDSFCGFDLH